MMTEFVRFLEHMKLKLVFEISITNTYCCKM